MRNVNVLAAVLLAGGGWAFGQGSSVAPFDPVGAAQSVGNAAITGGTVAGLFLSVSTVSDGVHPGSISLPGNTTLPTLPSNFIVDAGPNLATFNAWGKQWPSAGPGFPAAMCLSALSSSWTTISWCPFTGSGGTIVQSVSPTLTTPNLGTPSALVLTNATGLPNAGLVSSAVTVQGKTCTLGGTCTFSTPQVTVYTSGSGTYTVPTNAVRIEVTMVGGGAGGGGSGTSGGAGGNGAASTFGTLSAGGGNGPSSGSIPGGTGGAATGGDINIPGGAAATTPSTYTYYPGVMGGSSFYGAPGVGGNSGCTAGLAAGANTGSGGGGGGDAGTAPLGPGGGSGAYLEKLIIGPSATYSYSVGTAGSGGAAGTSGCAAGNGAAGLIRVTAFFQ